MDIEHQILEDLKALREKNIKLKKEELELATPILMNREHIPRIYGWYCELIDMHIKSKERKELIFEKAFLYVILRFYSPIAIVGGSMKRGLRDILAPLLGMKAPTGVSNHCSELFFWYEKYGEFQKEVDYFLKEIRKRLKAEGILI